MTTVNSGQFCLLTVDSSCFVLTLGISQVGATQSWRRPWDAVGNPGNQGSAELARRWIWQCQWGRRYDNRSLHTLNNSKLLLTTLHYIHICISTVEISVNNPWGNHEFKIMGVNHLQQSAVGWFLGLSGVRKAGCDGNTGNLIWNNNEICDAKNHCCIKSSCKQTFACVSYI